VQVLGQGLLLQPLRVDGHLLQRFY
jgi:hypothetical protein